MRTAIFAIALSLSTSLSAQSATPVVGTWEGESVCQVPKPCTTEHVIYEIRDAGSGTFTIKADKVVNGQREWMGDLTCTWSDLEQKLSCPMETRKPGDWVFTRKGETLTGTLITRADGVLVRRIVVHKK